MCGMHIGCVGHPCDLRMRFKKPTIFLRGSCKNSSIIVRGRCVGDACGMCKNSMGIEHSHVLFSSNEVPDA